MKDKQALREVAEKVNSGEWSYEEFNRMDLPGGAHININGRDAIYCLKKPVGGVEQSRAVTAFIAAFNPKVALALLDEVEAAEHTAAVDHEAACSLVEENEELKRRITEMESKNGNLRTIAHDQNELTIKANLDSINDAVEMDNLQKRIAELEAKLETADRLQDSAFRDGLKAGFSYGQTDDQSGFAQCMSAYSNAGIGVKHQEDSVDSDVSSRNQPGMVVAVHIDAGDFVKFKGQVFEVEETDFDDHDVTLWFVGGNTLKCAAGCQVEVVSAPVAAGIKVKES
ncbi:ead/Ea22-like family protein [Salmonella enterica]|uniref:Ead/Ea22-like family protein n=1 Tax=Salmonella enterica TaxID=28901 RepID=A0A5T3EKP2_SALER|nr:ead/Ea22-like family protein [Salmonella enterica subsp. enterica serovar Javiana]EAN2043059.1 ead/Ea22-like family protein [Salmonella enterica]EBC2493961.1 ead/Ea22-like family protein [Salmonella enterica subsp. enterica serovar Newport]EEN6799959.1 ead/Ea22-like family protein [Salmonella enterica subsp. enterica serovar Arechavaleta]EAS6269139.1 ead/Ea22-like family protein [Salmonella enterica]